MAATSVLTGDRSWFGDADRLTRTLRVSPHVEGRLVTLSVWDGRRCASTVRIPRAELPALVAALSQALMAVDVGSEVPPAVLVPEPVAVEPVAVEPLADRDPGAVGPPPSGPIWIAPAPDPMAQWLHGIGVVDGRPTDVRGAPGPPSPSLADLVVDVGTRALAAIGRGARAVADRLAPVDGPGPGPRMP